MSKAASGYERADLEKYYTPAWAVAALLEAETFDGLTLDPCAGGWHIVDAMRAAGLLCDGFDIEPAPGASGDARGDFFHMTALEFEARNFLNIVSNFPYGHGGRLGLKMLRHALELTSLVGGKVAALWPADWDSGSSRADCFKLCPAFHARYVLTKRIHWANLPVVLDKSGRPVGPTDNHMWAVWDWRRTPGTAKAGYLP